MRLIWRILPVLSCGGLLVSLLAPTLRFPDVRAEDANSSPAVGATGSAQATPLVQPGCTAVETLQIDGIEQVYRLSQRLIVGGQPQGAEVWQRLADLGVTTLISVDGMEPQVSAAEEAGLRYIHLPIGYDDVPAKRAQAIWYAISTAPGQVFLHCHHGKHRGPAAAMSVQRLIDPNLTAEQATETLKQLGTSVQYRGLYSAVETIHDRVPAWPSTPPELPACQDLAPLAHSMVQIEAHWTALAEWTEEPTSEQALSHWTSIGELATEAVRLDTSNLDEFRTAMREFAAATVAARTALESRQQEEPEVLFGRHRRLLEQHCTDCHALYRGNLPQ